MIRLIRNIIAFPFIIGGSLLLIIYLLLMGEDIRPGMGKQ